MAGRKTDSSPRVSSPLGSRTGLKKNLDEVIKKFDGNQIGKVHASDADDKVDEMKMKTTEL
jgi:hypothetical protein